MDSTSPARRATVFWGVGTLFLAVCSVVVFASVALLLIFAGVLFGTALRGLAEVVSRGLGCRLRWALALCLGVGLAAAVGASVWIIPNLAEQLAELTDKLLQAYQSLREAASRSPLGTRLLEQAGPLGGRLADAATGAVRTVASLFGGLGALVLVGFVAVYTAIAPEPYRHGLVRLVPPRHRERAEQLLDELGSTLRRWLMGRAVSMAAVGVVTGIGLWVLGVPLPFTLALIAGFFGFVPNIGPIVSAVPAALLAFSLNPLHALYVLILYLVVNLGDGYGLTPWLQKRAVALPPALILMGQLVLGALWGVLGVTLATPLVACALVLVRRLYVEGALEVPSRS